MNTQIITTQWSSFNIINCLSLIWLMANFLARYWADAKYFQIFFKKFTKQHKPKARKTILRLFTENCKVSIFVSSISSLIHSFRHFRPQAARVFSLLVRLLKIKIRSEANLQRGKECLSQI